MLQVMLGRHNGSAPLSSYSHLDLEVKTISSFFPHSLKALTVTETARGITGRQLLVGMVTDQVVQTFLEQFLVDILGMCGLV